MRPATLMSIAGVLATGGVAAFVNAQVLDSTARPHSDGVAITQSAVTTSSVPAPATTAAYVVGEAGQVVLDTSGGVVRIVEVVPAGGWSVTSSSTSPEGAVLVTFSNGIDTIDFEANIEGDLLRTVVDGSASLSPIPSSGDGATSVPSATVVTPTGPGTAGTVRPPGSVTPTTTDDDEGTDDSVDDSVDDSDDDSVDDPDEPDEPDEPDDD